MFSKQQLVDEFMGALPEADVRAFLDKHGITPAEAGSDENAEEAPVDTTVVSAMALYEQGDVDAARELLTAAQAADPTNAEVLLALGQVCVSTGDLETAASCLSALPEEHQTPNRLTAYRERLN